MPKCKTCKGCGEVVKNRAADHPRAKAAKGKAWSDHNTDRPSTLVRLGHIEPETCETCGGSGEV